MIEISLKQYLVKLNELIEEESYDEVIFHCRHILQQFPKNLAVYRYLGKILLVTERWDEASEVFHRILSVTPDDKIAHIGLSRIYYNAHLLVDAIWHLERVYEQG